MSFDIKGDAAEAMIELQTKAYHEGYMAGYKAGLIATPTQEPQELKDVYYLDGRN